MALGTKDFLRTPYYQGDVEDFPAVEVELPGIPGEEPVEEPQDFYGNLAEEKDDSELATMVSDLICYYEADLRSREDWFEAYIDGLDSLGVKKEDRTEPWDGACGVYHPILTEAVVRFQSNAIMEIFPAAGPTKPLIVGDETPDKIAQAQRVSDEINYQLTEKMVEYRGETEQLLFRLPLSGSMFRKVYIDKIKNRPCSMMVPCEDFIVDYGATDLDNCERYTHVMRKSKHEIDRLMEVGFYRQLSLPDPETDNSEVKEKEQEISGHKPSFEKETRRVLLEMHCDYPCEGDEVRPYVVTIDKQSMKVLAIRRNWTEGDPSYAKRQYFVHYQYLPGLGFYGFGLIHLLGGIAESATSILRQLVDAGTLSNLPGGLKTKGLRTKEENLPIAPGEWRDVDVPAGAIRDNLYPLPYKEPSAVLYQLLTNIIEEGRRIGSVADIEVGEMQQNSPVGTVLALLERSMKVMSAIHARIHAALRRELALISRVIGEDMSPQYDWDDQKRFDRKQDFDGRVDIIPVSDPNAATQTAKVVQLQTVMQMAMQSPEIYDMKELHRQGLAAIGMRDVQKLIKEDKPPPLLDPVSENMGILTGQPVKVYMEQDHDAHLKVHLAAMVDPKIMSLVQKSPSAPKLQAAMEAHIAEHVGFAYRRDVEKAMGVSLPPPGQQLPPELEANLSRMMADVSDQVLEQHKQEGAWDAQMALSADPVFQLREREVALKERESELKARKTEHDMVMDENKFVKDLSNIAADNNLAEEKLYSDERKASAKIAADLITFGAQLDQQERESALALGDKVEESIRSDVKEMLGVVADLDNKERDRQQDSQEREKDRQLQREVESKKAEAAKAKAKAKPKPTGGK